MINSNIKSAVLQYSIGLIVFCAMTYFIMSTLLNNSIGSLSSSTDKKVSEIQRNIDSINKKQTELTRAINSINESNFYLVDQVNRNNGMMEQYNRELVKMKNQYNAKIRSISNYSAYELDSVFANKYGAFFQNKR